MLGDRTTGLLKPHCGDGLFLEGPMKADLNRLNFLLLRNAAIRQQVKRAACRPSLHLELIIVLWDEVVIQK
jgi:hypothetical protein